MRVTSNSFSSQLVDQLGSLSSRQNRLQNQAASGQRITLPEDDPHGTSRVLELQAEAGTVGQYQKNIETQQQTAQASYQAMQSLKTISDRAGEIATLADGLKSPEELKTYAAEITQLIRQAVQVTNSKNNDSYLFAGTNSDQTPFALTEDADGHITDVAYSGNSSLSQVEVAEGMTITAQTVGANTSGTGPTGLITDSRTGGDFFAHLITLQNHLLSGDTSAIASSDRAQLAQDESNLLCHIASNGAVQSRLEASASLATTRATSLQQNVSGLSDADLAQTLVQLSEAQTAYQAALQTGAKVLQLSLLDFLR
jgi:flagellar hook-associated protein 3 FlgL